MTINLSQYKKHEVVPIAALRVGDIWIKSDGTYYYIVTSCHSKQNPKGLMEGYNLRTQDSLPMWQGIMENNARILNSWVTGDASWVFMRKEVVMKIFVDELE